MKARIEHLKEIINTAVNPNIIKEVNGKEYNLISGWDIPDSSYVYGLLLNGMFSSIASLKLPVVDQEELETMYIGITSNIYGTDIARQVANKQLWIRRKLLMALHEGKGVKSSSPEIEFFIDKSRIDEIEFIKAVDYPKDKIPKEMKQIEDIDQYIKEQHESTIN